MTHLSEHSDPTDALPDHTLESILACLPFPSVLVTRCVSKRWHSLATSSTFLTLYSERQQQAESWLYVNGLRYKVTDHTSSPTPIPESSNHSWGAGGLAYTFSETSSQLHSQLQYKLSLLDPLWLTTPALPFPRTLPVVAAVKNLPNGAHRVIVAGGLKSETNKESLSTVSIFDSASQTWSSCEDLPREFQGLATSRSVTAVVNNRTLYLLHIYSGLVASLDVTTRRWSPVTTLLRPPGMQYCYLAARHGALLLVGVSPENNRFCFRGWNVAASVMECYGESWPVVCHFGGVKSSRSFGKWQSKKQSDEALVVTASPSVLAPMFAIANLLKRISFWAGIFRFFETLLEFSKTISLCGRPPSDREEVILQADFKTVGEGDCF